MVDLSMSPIAQPLLLHNQDEHLNPYQPLYRLVAIHIDLVTHYQYAPVNDPVGSHSR